MPKGRARTQKSSALRIPRPPRLPLGERRNHEITGSTRNNRIFTPCFVLVFVYRSVYQDICGCSLLILIQAA
jgi:hypothetical protein